MVGFVHQPTIEEDDQSQASKSKNFKYPIEDTKLFDLSFADSFPDFDSIKGFFEDSSCKDSIFNSIDWNMDDKGSCFGSKPTVDSSNPSLEDGSVSIEIGSGLKEEKEEKVGLEEVRSFGSCIEEEMGKVSLVGSYPVCGDAIVLKSESVSGGMETAEVNFIAGPCSVSEDVRVDECGVAGNEMDMGNANLASGSNSVVGVMNTVNDVPASEEYGSESDSESDNGSSSSSSSSSSDSDSSSEEEEEDEDNDDEKAIMQSKREVEECEIEEGEIRDFKDEDDEEDEDDAEKMVAWSDVEEGEADDEAKGPIRSKNELQVLPPVPPVDITLQPHHQMLAVGTVLSIVSAQVIVEGVEKHNPLNEGSILWITEKRTPLGIVDEIFGPVQSPYYIVRYNSESEVPARIHQGTSISFVPEFVDHVLKNQNLYKKGYDASGENDEELMDDAEFSDDEKEAEYKRMLKNSKRGLNGETVIVGKKKNNRKKFNNRNRNQLGVNQPPSIQNQQYPSSVGASMNNSSPATTGQDFRSGTRFFSSVSPMFPTSGLFQPSNGIWINGLPSQHPQNATNPGGFPANNISWHAQNQLGHPSQIPFQQQFNPSQTSVLNGMLLPGGQMNLFARPSLWPAQNFFNPAAAFGMGFQPAPNPNTTEGDQGMLSNGPLVGQTGNLASLPVTPDNIQEPQQYNPGSSTGNRRKSFHHRGGGGRFSGGRGRCRGRQSSK